MKRILTLALALVLALGLAVPAMAFTSDSEAADDSVPYSLKIYLVEYDDNDLFGIVTLPESDRGYAKNEIVAAVVELDVPDEEDLVDDGYTNLVFGGTNVDLEVTDNNIGAGSIAVLDCAGLATDTDQLFYDTVDDRLVRDMTGLDADETYKWLFYAKVEDDDAMLVAKLVDGTQADEFVGNNLFFTIDGDNYYVVKNTPSGDDGYYTIYCNVIDVNDDDAITVADTYEDAIRIYVDEDHVSTGMSILDTAEDTAYGVLADPGAFTALGVNTKNELGIVVGALIETGDDAEDILDIYEDIVVDVFGMDYFLIGNYVRDSFFEGLRSSDTVVAMVEIQPWTAYVTVPDNIVVDPPKTGDAASIMGFVMVALSGAGVVALRKRG